jgi:polysaccharide biosynthesis transport protein
MNKANEEINLAEIIKSIARYWILIILVTAVAVGGAYLYTTNMMEPTYKATSILFVGKEIGNEESLDLTDIQVGKQLLADYGELIMTDIIVETVINDLSLDTSPAAFRNALSINIIGESRFLNISYTSSDPGLAANIANSLSDILVAKSIEVLKENNIQVIDYAKVPTAAIGPNLFLNVVVAGIGGLILSLFIVMIIIMTNTTFLNEREIEKGTGIAVLGVIPKFKQKRKIGGRKNIIPFADHDSVMSQSFRRFRMNMDYISLEHKQTILMFTTPSFEDGKAVSIINTAISYGQAGKKVLLIECDFYEKRLHELLQLPQTPGIRNCILNGKSLAETVRKVAGIDCISFLAPGIITQQEQTDIFSTQLFTAILGEARTKYDMILINTPPVLGVTDAAIISAKADAVILLVEQKKTRREAVDKAVRVLGRANSNIAGIIVNRSAGNRSKLRF